MGGGSMRFSGIVVHYVAVKAEVILYAVEPCKTMKLVITIVQAYDSDRLLRAVTSAGMGATKINSVGGFLRMANSTILMALDDDRVDDALGTIRSIAQRRVEVKMDAAESEFSEWYAAGFHEVKIGGAVVFVLPIDSLYQIYPDHIEQHEKAPV